jgi:uncharacterized membrane protein YgcG
VVAFPRLAATRRDRVGSSARWVARALAALGATGACLLFASPAAALVTEVEFESAKVKAGIAPRNSSTIVDGTYLGSEIGEYSFNSSPEFFSNPLGHPVVHAAQVFVVYWDPTDHYHGDWQNVIDTFMHEAGGEPGVFRNDVLALDGQYTDTSNKPASAGLTFRGAYTDDTHYPAEGCEDPRQLYKQEASKVKALTCLSDKQVQTELQSFVSSHALPTGMSTIYDVLTPPGVTVCLDGGTATGHCSDFKSSIEEQTAKEVGASKREARIYSSASFKNSFCSYHSDINPGGTETGDANTILYDVIPWTAGGVGDGQLAAADQREEYLCQDGGFDPTSKPTELKESTPKFAPPPEPRGEHSGGEAEYLAWGTEEKEAWLRGQEPAGPHVEEPNQVKCPSPDGFCDTGLADLIINQIAVQQQDTVTDPLLNAWNDLSKNEAADECRNSFAPAGGSSSLNTEGTGAGSAYDQTIGGHNYYLNTSFNLSALKLNYPAVPCLPGMTLDPKFTAPSAVNPEEVVTFDGMESDISMGAAAAYNEKGEETPNYAKFSWTFGDGTPAVSGYAPGAPACETPWLSPCAASVSHAYKFGGTYNVTLTVTDVAGNTASTTQRVTVVGPPAPSAGGEGGSGGSSSGGSGSGGSSSGGSSTSGGSSKGGGVGTTAAPSPVVSELVLSKSLRTVVKHGLAVRYSVSEQVAGRFQVLLATSLAHRLHLSGASATGLAAGTPPETVIGKAILVTTKGGTGTLTIQLSAKAADRLRHMHSVTLTVQLVVHNAHAKSANAIAGVALSH